MTPKEALSHARTLVADYGFNCKQCSEMMVIFSNLVNQPRTVAEIREEVERMIENVQRDLRLPVIDREGWTTDGAIMRELKGLLEFIDGEGK